ncbi:MAG: glycosyl hydrolase family 18 protein [Bacteroidota bacterium]
MHAQWVKTLVTVAAYFLAQQGGVDTPPAGAGGTGTRAVIGYYSEYYPGESRPYNALRANARTLTAIAPFSYYLDASGNLSGTHLSKAVSTAKASGLKVLALIHNFTRKNGFEGGTAHKVLSNHLVRARAVAKITSLVRSQGYSGINLDLENVYAIDRANYTAFVRELAQALRPLGYLVTASVPAKVADDRSNNWSGAFDYGALAPWLDQIMLMTYDENGALGHAGPVASLPWVERVVRFARSHIPSRKIVVGLAGYGYDWVQGRTGAKGKEFPEIQSLVNRLGVTPKWDAASKVPYIRYSSGGQSRIIWYENSWSAALKLDLVNRYNLGGVALWRLGGEDPRLWKVIWEKFGRA